MLHCSEAPWGASGCVWESLRNECRKREWCLEATSRAGSDLLWDQEKRDSVGEQEGKDRGKNLQGRGDREEHVQGPESGQ